MHSETTRGKRWIWLIALVAICLIIVVVFSACGMDKYTEPFRDAPRSSVVNSEPADIIEMPDGFNNLATKCDHGNRVYITYHGDKPYGAPAVVPQDPTCNR